MTCGLGSRLFRWISLALLLLSGYCFGNAEKRVALVIGNAAYTQAPLRNPVNDANDIAGKLRERGFDVILRTNLKTNQIGRTLREFRSKLTPGAVALVFYAGHGLQVKGENYLPSVDADIEGEEDIPNQSLAVRQLLDSLDEAKTSLNLVFLDACRNNPYSRRFRSAADGLARTAAPSGTLISFATRPGSVAADGEGHNGLYTQHLLQAVDIPNQPVEQVLKVVARGVKQASQGRQEPWMEGSIEGDFYFLRRADEPARPSATDKALEESLRLANEKAAREKEELKASMESALAEALKRQRHELEAASRRDTPQPSATPPVPPPAQVAIVSKPLAPPRPSESRNEQRAAAVGDEWEYVAKDHRFNKTHTLRQRVAAIASNNGILEEFVWDGKAAGEWTFDGQAGLVAAPTEAGFVFAPHWRGEQLPPLRFLGTHPCNVGNLSCVIQVRQVGQESVSVAAGEFKTLKIEGTVAYTQSGVTMRGSFICWIDVASHRLIKQYGVLTSAIASLNVDNFEETVELAAIRTAPH